MHRGLPWVPLVLLLAWSTPLGAQADRGSSAREQQSPPRVTFTFDEAPVDQVALAFAEVAGRSIVLGGDVTGSVTAIVQDEPWDAAFLAILQSQGLRAVELDSGIILVERLETVQGREDFEELVTRVFPIRFQVAAELEASIQAVLSERGTVSVAWQSNALVVTDIPEAIERVEVLLWGTPEEISAETDGRRDGSVGNFRGNRSPLE